MKLFMKKMSMPVVMEVVAMASTGEEAASQPTGTIVAT
jgi:hypothetical protein